MQSDCEDDADRRGSSLYRALPTAVRTTLVRERMLLLFWAPLACKYDRRRCRNPTADAARGRRPAPPPRAHYQPSSCAPRARSSTAWCNAATARRRLACSRWKRGRTSSTTSYQRCSPDDRVRGGCEIKARRMTAIPNTQPAVELQKAALAPTRTVPRS